MSILPTPSRPAMSVAVPCFNEEGSQPDLYRRLSAVCRSITDSHEILLMLVSGVELFIMGIIGEYAGRPSIQIKARSLFIVKEIVAGPVVVSNDLVRG